MTTDDDFLLPALGGSRRHTTDDAHQAAPSLGGGHRFDHVLIMLHSSDRDARVAALLHISEVRDRRTLPALIGALRDDDELVRLVAADRLEWYAAHIPNELLVDKLLDALQDEDPDVIRAAAYALAAVDDGRAVPGLREALYHNNQRVRRAALRVLGVMADAENVIPDIIKCMEEDTDWRVRQEAARTLGAIGSQRATLALRRVMTHDENHAVRVMAQKARARLKAAT